MFIHYTIRELLSQFSSCIVDEHDMNWIANEKKSLLLKKFHEMFFSKTLSLLEN